MKLWRTSTIECTNQRSAQIEPIHAWTYCAIVRLLHSAYATQNVSSRSLIDISMRIVKERGLQLLKLVVVAVVFVVVACAQTRHELN